MVVSLKELKSSRRNDMPFVLGVSRTTLSFGDLLGLVRFRNFPTLGYSLLPRKDAD